MKSLLLLSYTIMSITSHSQVPQNIQSELIILNIKTGKEKVVLKESRHFEAPNWSRDGKYLLFNSGGKLEKVSVKGKKLGVLNTDFADRCNNDHGFSFDGKTVIISHNDAKVNGSSRIFYLPVANGKPKLITEKYPSYWHGISPDGQYIVYCAERNGEWDVYKIRINGGEEKRLTDAPGLDDGPEYSYDGQWIYFNSNRTGRMHLYRMKPDGSAQEQLTFDDYDNWFPHPSPDGKLLVYIAYVEDQKGKHPFGKDVKLRLYDTVTKTSKDITPVFYGGQGTINVHSWSPDGKSVAFVRYIR